MKINNFELMNNKKIINSVKKEMGTEDWIRMCLHYRNKRNITTILGAISEKYGSLSKSFEYSFRAEMNETVDTYLKKINAK